MKLITCHVGSALCGIEVVQVQEINKVAVMTPVPGAAAWVAGILNLRGQIVTVVDLGRKLGLTAATESRGARNIVARSEGEAVGLLVDSVGDVVEADEGDRRPVPANLGEIQGRYFTGVVQTSDRLIGILDLAAVLADESVTVE